MSFAPLPLLGNPHVQTILGALRRETAWGIPFRERHLLLSDGDRLLLYDSIPARWRRGGTMALVVHGLCGSHRSANLLRLTRLLLPLGYRVVRMDLRGAGRGIRWARGFYTAAASHDVRAAIEEMRRWSPNSPIVAVGFSLGGNLVLKMAGEMKQTSLRQLKAVAAVSPPIDTEACSALLATPANRIYDRYFAKGLAASVRRRRLFFPDQPAIRFPSDLTLRQFDELFTAPRNGYADAADYYRRAASLPLIPGIAIPTLILTSRDDPFIAVEPIASLPPMPHLRVCIEKRGGHLGFVGHTSRPAGNWLERRLVTWLRQTVPAVGEG